MNKELISEVSKSLQVKPDQVVTVLNLLEEGNTIPFIARYRKEVTGGLDEEQIGEIHKEWSYGVSLQKRKDDVIRLIDEKGLMTEALLTQINASTKLVEVEDLYRPYKEKKKTKATEAIKNGLEPFAEWIKTFPVEGSLSEEALKYLNENVKNEADAIQGAKYIIAEQISDHAEFRKALRELMAKDGVITSKAKKEATTLDEKGLYEQYYDHLEKVSTIPQHRVLAMNRAEAEKVITVTIDVDKDQMQAYLETKIIGDHQSFVNDEVKDAIADSIKRLIYPSIEREIRSELTSLAEDQAIEVFAVNLKNLLLQPPMKEQVVLGMDPAFRTGVKLAVVNQQGTVLEKGVIEPHEKYIGEKGAASRIPISQRTVVQMIKKHNVDIIAIGNGTASRETEAFVSNLLKEYKLPTKYVIVNESGASVYSASEIARKEFPDYSVEERSAVSIARRLQDPLSELVKIDPKSIGVGQYQHDVSQKKLSDTLDIIVSNAVNSVGVNVNTASESLLNYVSGFDKRVSENLVAYRDKNGAFKNRKDLMSVPRLGEKAFEQSAGFLRITEGSEALDMTSIHPESYEAAKKVMNKLKLSPEMIGKPMAQLYVGILTHREKQAMMEDFGIDKYTLDDILDAFVKPLRDPRDEFSAPQLRSDILNLEDLKEGMQLEGTVRNVVAFGAFVDVGLHEDGLVHISKMSKSFVKDPSTVVSVGDVIKVWVIGIDKVKGKVSLSMIPPR
ncbi:MAG: RNA-binding transcriptional accessory protein [Acholeplasmataceae bacterium]|nr:RNA-binding transcriptional accessory protein [Acholeplasmataceae bacterium]